MEVKKNRAKWEKSIKGAKVRFGGYYHRKRRRRSEWSRMSAQTSGMSHKILIFGDTVVLYSNVA
jgi:hypothetical protein